MVNNNISPEERLFKSIQEGKDRSTEKKKEEPVEKTAAPRKKLLPEKVKVFFSGLKLRLKRKAGNNFAAIGGTSRAIAINVPEMSLGVVNGVLFIISFFLVIMVFYRAVNTKPNVAKITNAISGIQFQAVKEKTIEAFKPVSFYLEQIKKRDIFHPVPIERAKTVTKKVQQKRAKLKELAGNLKLVGISWGSFPTAMIADTKNGNTYFLKEGQQLGATGIEVKSVSKEKVIIGFDDEEMEL